MAKTIKVTVELTLLEARCLWMAAGQTIEWSDAIEATFGKVSERNAADRAYRKLIAAWRAAFGDEQPR